MYYSRLITGSERRRRINKRREELGMTWQELANRLKVSLVTIQTIAKNNRIYAHNAFMIAYHLKMNPNKLVWDNPSLVKKKEKN